MGRILNHAANAASPARLRGQAALRAWCVEDAGSWIDFTGFRGRFRGAVRTFFATVSFALLVPFASHAGIAFPNGSLLGLPDGSFVGTTNGGGPEGIGAAFRITRFSELTVIGQYASGAAENPTSGFIDDGAGKLWGTSQFGGANDLGTIYRCDPATGAIAVQFSFAGGNGRLPSGPLVMGAPGVFYGTTSRGGMVDAGTVFGFDSATGTLTTVVDFTGLSGAAVGSEPEAGLFQDAGGVLWGTTSRGGALGQGTVFKIDAGVFTSVASFTGTNGAALGSAPRGELIDDGAGALLGTASSGGANGLGTIFRVNKTTGAVTALHSFSGTDGAVPLGRLVSDGAGFFWGTTSEGGASNLGTVFKINAAGALTKVVDFTGQTGAFRGAYPRGGMTADASGSLWGTCRQGGREDDGTIWRVTPSTGAFTFILESEAAPQAPVAAVATPSKTETIGNAGDPLTLRGVTSDGVEVVQVLISLNGGAFVPAQLSSGPRPGTYNWALAIIPENGVNEVLVRSVDSGGSSSSVVKLVFNYTVIRPENEGGYTGLVTAVSLSPVASPAAFSGMFTLKARKDGRFTGKLVSGALPKAVAFTGAFGNDGTLRFGKKGTPALVIPRKNQPPLELALAVDVVAPFTRQITGTLKEGASTLATLLGDQAIYSAKKVLVPPYIRVPVAVLDPATNRGRYTAALLPLDAATQGLPASQYPQGAGIAAVSAKSTGIATFAGKAADGTPFVAAAPLSRDNVFPLYAKLATVKGALTGWATFHDMAGASDIDGANIRWFRAANAKAKIYPAGWPDGIFTDLAGSKFVKDITKTPLGSSTGTVNATVKLDSGLLPSALENELSVGLNGITSVLGPPVGATGATGLQIKFTTSGAFSGKFSHTVDSKVTPFSGVVFQKTGSAYGFFLRAPESGLVEVTTK